MMATVADAYKADLLDVLGESLDTGGYAVFLTAGDAEVFRIVFNDDAFGAATGTGTVTVTANQTPALMDTDVDGNANPVTKFKCKTSADADVVEGTVGLVGSGADCEMSSVILNAGDAALISLFRFKMESA